MEKFQEALEKSRQNLKVAEHMVFVTYPFVKDNKILLAVVENIFLSMTNTMGALLHYERLFRQIPPFHDNYESKLRMFKEKLVRKFRIDQKNLLAMEELKNIILDHKKSPVEFSRANKLVICSDDYSMKTISIESVKVYLSAARQFQKDAEGIVSVNETIFG